MKALSGREFCRLLEKHGWRLRRIAGSHHICAHPGIANILVLSTRGKTLKQGLQRALLKAAGIDVE